MITETEISGIRLRMMHLVTFRFLPVQPSKSLAGVCLNDYDYKHGIQTRFKAASQSWILYPSFGLSIHIDHLECSRNYCKTLNFTVLAGQKYKIEVTDTQIGIFVKNHSSVLSDANIASLFTLLLSNLQNTLDSWPYSR